MEDALLSEIRTLVGDLARGALAEIVLDRRAGRLSLEALSTAIRNYGRTLLPLPDEGVPLISIYPSQVEAEAVYLDVPLWTVEEGRSDLTLSLTAYKVGGAYRLEIEDLHVL
jgi:hypothetical protein